MKVLMVDDEQAFLDQAELFLEEVNEDLEINKAFSASEGLELIEKNDYDVIVSDYQMPEMDGLEFLEIVKTERDMEIPFIFFTGKGREEVAMEALNLGADRYLKKGGDPKTQFKVLAQAISQEFWHYETRKQLELTKSSVDKSTTGIFWVNPEGKFLYTNRRVEEKLGYSKDELQEMYVWDVDVDHEKDEKIRKKHWERLKEERSERIERKHKTKEGKVFPVEIYRNYIKHGDRELEFAFVNDITERKRKEEELKESEKRYRRLFNSINVGLVVHDSEGNIVSANPAAEKALGSKEKELQEKGLNYWRGILFEEDGDSMDIQDFPVSKVYDSKEEVQESVIGISPPGSEGIRWYVISAIPHLNDEEEIQRVVTSFKEITELKRTEDALRKAEKKYKSLFYDTPLGTLRFDENGVITDCNEKFVEIIGSSNEALIGFDMINELKNKDLLEEVENSLSDGKGYYEGEYTSVTGGKATYVRVLFKGLKDDQGNIQAGMGLVEDITERKEKEEKLKKSEERYRRLFETAQDGMLILDAETGIIKDANPYILNLLNYSKDELIGKKVWVLGSFDNVAENKKKFEELVEEGYVRYEDLPLIDKDGIEVPVEFVSNTYEVRDEKVAQCNIRNISERKEAERKAKELRSLRDSVRRVTQKIIEKDDLENFYKEACGILLDTRHYLDVSIAIYQDEILTSVAHCGDHKRKSWELSTDGSGNAPECVREVVESKDTKIIGSTETYCDECEYCKYEGDHQSVLVPLIEDEKIEGILSVCLKLENEIPEDEIDLLKEVARDIRIAKDKITAENELKKSRSRLIRSQKVGKTGSWELYPETNELEWSEGTYRIFEVSQDEPMNYEKFLDFIHPEDKDYVDKKWKEALETGDYDIEHRIKVDGKTKWVREKADISFDEDGEPKKIVGSVQDITDMKEKEKEIKRANKFLETTIDSLTANIAILDGEGRIIDVNKSWMRFGDSEGLDYENYGIGENYLEITEEATGIGSDKSEEAAEKLKEIIDGEREEFSLKYPCHSPVKRRWFVMRAKRFEVDEELYVVISHENITEREKARRSLEHLARGISDVTGQELFDSIVEELCSGFGVEAACIGRIKKDKDEVDSLSMKIDDEWISEYRYDLEGTPCRNVTEGEACLYRKDICKEYPEDEELEDLNAEGYFGVPVRDEEGETIGVIWGVSKDKIEDIPSNWKKILDIIASRVASEIKRLEMEEEYRNLIEHMNDDVFIHDLEGNFLTVNQEAVDRYGYSRDELKNMTPENINAPEYVDRIPKLMEDLQEEGTKIFESVHLTKDGMRIPVEISSTMTTYQGQKVIISVARNIKDREERRKELNLLYTTLRLGADPDIKLSKILEDTAENIPQAFQYPEITTAKIILDNKEYGKNDQEIFSKLEEEITVDEEVRGKIIVSYLEETPQEDIGPFLQEEKDMIEALSDVISNMILRRERKERLENSEKRYRSMIENSVVGVTISDFDDNILFVNERFSDLLGYDKEELEGKNISEIVPEEEYDRISRKTEKRKEGKKDVYETRLTKRGGEDINVLMGATPYKDPTGEVVGSISFVQDISERKKIEDREAFLHSLLRHDIRNKIQVIQGYLQLMEDEEFSEEGVKYFENTKKTVKNSIDLIEKIRILRKASEEEIEMIDIQHPLKDAVENSEKHTKHMNIEVNIDCRKSCEVKAGPLLNEVFSNLIENSIKYSSGSKISISVEEEEDKILCTIEDDGKGITDENKDKIFQKGYTTDEDRGTGLGLFLVKKLLEIYGASIEIKDSELGGARFDIELEKAEE